ncbi:maltotransferase domain-containing protein, partial [Mycolicibacterium fortuitum]
MAGRIGIDDVAPVVFGGQFPAKAVVGEVVPVRATVWREGHDAVAATLVVRYLGTDYPRLATGPGTAAVPVPIDAVMQPAQRIKPQALPMAQGDVPDVFHGQFTPDSVGLWTYRVDGWGDPIATWRHAVEAKLGAGQSEAELSNDLLVGARLLERAATGVPRKLRDPLIEAAAALRTPGDPFARAGAALSEEVTELLDQYPLRELVTRGDTYGVWVDRPLARFSSW